MVVSISSRYRGHAVHAAADPRGAVHATVSIRRHVPPPAGAAYRHVVSGLEDLEYLAWRLLGSSESWWRIADANPLAFPLDLRPGDTLTVAVAADAGTGQVDRERVF